MTSLLHRATQFLRFYYRAGTVRQVHAPFAFAFAKAVLEEQGLPFPEEPILQVRSSLRNDPEEVDLLDLGAGSAISVSRRKTIGSIARQSAGPLLTLHRLARAVAFSEARDILELGTSLGMSGLYLSGTGARLRTLEGSSVLAQKAEDLFQRLGRRQVRVVTGPFRQTLPKVLEEGQSPDLIYLDGDHRGLELEWQVKQCLPFIHPNTVIAIDDLYWSKDMLRAWQRIRKFPEVRLSIDTFFTGFLFFREEILVPQHYDLVPTRWKPWQTGIRLIHPRS